MLLLLIPGSSLGMAQKPWDLRRFATTAAFFNNPQDVIKRTLPPNPFAAAPKLGEGGIIWNAQNPLLEWGSLDDVVMGGVSESSFVIAGGIGTFSGQVSTDNNGGFAGCRSKALTPPLKLGACSGLKLRVRGDGRRYKFIVRDSYDWNGIAWSQSFDTRPLITDDDWQECLLPFDEFVPTLFAKKVPGATLKTDAINTIQITYSKFEYDKDLNPAFGEGPFQLKIDSIAAVPRSAA